MTIKSFLISSALLALITLQVCGTYTKYESQASHPVNWTTGLTLPALLTSSIKINMQNDLKQLIDAPWYTEIAIINSTKGHSVFNSCKDYFEQAIGNTRSKKPNEMAHY